MTSSCSPQYLDASQRVSCENSFNPASEGVRLIEPIKVAPFLRIIENLTRNLCYFLSTEQQSIGLSNSG